jgi:translation initiation factor IF-2
MSNKDQKSHIVNRPPVVVVMGHVDHGKSTLLDYIRKTNVVADEFGGITQHISAYEVVHQDEKKQNRLITFLDTPGHEAFSKMRARGAEAADVAILVISSEDSVKTQTFEAYETIIEKKIPYLIAINKIDKPNANIEKVKNDLAEKGIYLEGSGGNIPFICISSKTGEGINDLLDMVLLLADLEELSGDLKEKASGVLIEAICEPKRGISATCIIKNGVLRTGMFIVCGTSMLKVKILENFLGKQIKEATFSSPVFLTGFDSMPEVGNIFNSFETKKEADFYINWIKKEKFLNKKIEKEEDKEECEKIIPLIIKTDVSGSVEAIQKEILKLNTSEISFKIISSGVGAINESDLKMASASKKAIIIGFNIKIDNGARDLNESLKVNIYLSDIIYKITDWLKEVIEKEKPKKESIETLGFLKILKIFSSTKNKKVIGGKVLEGKITSNSEVKIKRRDFEIGKGKITELQQNKIKTKEVLADSDCGILLESKVEIAVGDVLEAFIINIE